MKDDVRPPLGILMLDADFERPPGDVGNAASWPFPVVFERVGGATPRRIVDGDDDDLVDAFVAAGGRLAARGAVGLISSCGFLASRQRDLGHRMPLPFASSALLQLPLVARALPRGLRPGVVTYDSERLGRRHFEGAGADPATPCVGLAADGAFRDLIEGGARYDRAGLESDVCNAVARLLATNERIGALVFECTNLPAFSGVVRERFGLPVYDVLTLGRWFYAGLTQMA